MKIDLFTAKAPPLFGLDISSSSVKMLELVDAGKGGYRVERYAIEPLARDSVVDGNINNLEAVGDAVKRAYQRLGTRTKHVAMAVPTGAVISKKIIVSAALREEELEIQVESEANQYIPFALEEVNLDFQVLGPSPANPEEQEVLIAATRKEKVEDRVAVADIGGLKPLVMDVESFAQQTALSLVVQGLPGSGKDQNIAVVDVGANVMNVTVLRNDQSVYTREQAFGGNQLTQDIVSRYGMTAEEAENAKRSGGLPDDFEVEVMKPFMENLSMEVQRALQFFFTSTQYHAVDHILLAGGSAVIPGLDEVVNTRTQVPAIVGIALAFLMYQYYERQISTQNDRNNFLATEIKKLDKDIAEINELRNQIQALLARKQIIETLQADRAQTVHLLEQMVRQMPEGVYLKSIRQTSQKVHIVGYAQSNARVSTLMRNIEASPWLDHPLLGEVQAASTPDKKRVSEFNMYVQLKRAAAKDAAKAAPAKDAAKKG